MAIDEDWREDNDITWMSYSFLWLCNYKRKSKALFYNRNFSAHLQHTLKLCAPIAQLFKRVTGITVTP